MAAVVFFGVAPPEGAVRSPGAAPDRTGAGPSGEAIAGGAASGDSAVEDTVASAGPVIFTDQERARILQYAPLGPLPADPTNAVADDPGAARLGQQLFFEPRLSRGGFSCASCHVPPHAFTDGKPVSEALAKGTRRTPSLLNVAYRRWLFWDGRKDTLWSQALSPIESDAEMGGSRLAVAHLIASDPELRAAYEALFGTLPDLGDRARFPPAGRPSASGANGRSGAGGANGAAVTTTFAVTTGAVVAAGSNDPLAAAWQGMRDEDRLAVDRVFTRAGKALEAYERRLVGKNSQFDRFLAELRAGKDGASLSEPARRGLRLFVGRGNCRVCHSGPDLSDGEFHDIGVPPAPGAAVDSGRYGGIDELLADPFNARGPFADGKAASASGAPAAVDKLRGLRRQSEHWGQFKTPSLRNVAVRPPYMHQGQLASLRDVLRFYSTRDGAPAPGPAQERLLVPLHLTDEETNDLLAFLESLTDEPIDDVLLFRPGDPLMPAHHAP